MNQTKPTDIARATKTEDNRPSGSAHQSCVNPKKWTVIQTVAVASDSDSGRWNDHWPSVYVSWKLGVVWLQSIGKLSSDLMATVSSQSRHTTSTSTSDRYRRCFKFLGVSNFSANENYLSLTGWNQSQRVNKAVLWDYIHRNWFLM